MMFDDMYDRPVHESSIAHVALALVLDVSCSMHGRKMELLNSAVNNLILQMQQDARLRDIVDLGIFTFGELGKQPVLQGFRAMSDCNQVSMVANQHSSYVVDSLTKAIDVLRIRCNIYNNGGGSYKPWLVLITDGEFHDEPSEIQRVGNLIKQRESQNKLQFFGLGVDSFRKEQLLSLTNYPDHVIEAEAANFIEFLSWIGRSFAIISSKEIGATVSLEPLVFTV